MTRRINLTYTPVQNGIPQGNISTFSTGKASPMGQVFKPKKAGKKKSHVVFVLDSSSSMRSCQDATIEAYNEFLDSQVKDQEESGIKTRASLYVFDGSNLTGVMHKKKVKKVERLNRDTYDPRGMTNLYDAIGGVMMAVNEDFASKKKKDRESVIICILTDGQENASRVFNNQDIRQMIEKAEGANWAFSFMGANINAFDVGQKMGFRHENTMQFNTSNVKDAIRSSSRFTSTMKSNLASGTSADMAYRASAYTDAEREASTDGKDTV